MTEDVVTMQNAVTRVARAVGIVRAGKEPTAHDAADLREQMQGVFDRLPNLRNGVWRDVLLTSGAAYTARDGDRISPQGFDPVITLPTTFTRCDSDTSIQNDLSRVHVIGDGFFIWSSSLGAWNKVDNLKLSDPFPFGSEDLPGLVAMTAILAAGEYGAEISPAMISVASGATAGLRSRLYRARPSFIDDYRWPTNGYFRDYN